MTDIRLYTDSIKRPDASCGIRPRALPNPPPPWVKFLPNGDAYPNVVLEVAVNNESPVNSKRIVTDISAVQPASASGSGLKSVFQEGSFGWHGQIDRPLEIDPHQHEAPTASSLNQRTGESDLPYSNGYRLRQWDRYPTQFSCHVGC